VRLRSILLALGVGVVGCSKNKPGPALPAYATLTDVSQPVSFSPDGVGLVVPNRPQVSFCDLEKKSVRWRHTADRERVGVTFSPSGLYVLMVAADRGETSVRLTVLRAADGSRVFEKELPSGGFDPLVLPNNVTRMFAVSDDGAFVAWTPDLGVEIWSTADGSVAYKESDDRATERLVTFAPKGHRALYAAGSYRVRVIDLVKGVWKPIETLEGAFDPQWTAAGWVFGALQNGPPALDLWDGKKRRTLIEDWGLAKLDTRPSVAGFARRRVSGHLVELECQRLPRRACQVERGALLIQRAHHRFGVLRVVLRVRPAFLGSAPSRLHLHRNLHRLRDPER
jgi:hypothetical protein